MAPQEDLAHKKPDSRKRHRSNDGDHGGQSAKKKVKPWDAIGICWAHFKFGKKALDCKTPCLWVVK